MSNSLIDMLPETKHIPAAERLLKPKTNAIPLLQTNIARYGSYAITGQTLLYYYLRAGSLVANPLATMMYDLLPLALSQCLFCAVCLPSVGRWNSGTDAGEMIKGTANTNSKTFKPTVRKKPGPNMQKTSAKSTNAGDTNIGEEVLARLFPTILALIMSIMIPTVPLMALAFVLGAPLWPTSLLPHTMILTLHVALLGTLPIFYTHGVSGAAWREISAAWLPFDEAGVWGGMVGTLVGGWLGAIPIALDWDREWQKWPCTVLWGVVMGWAAGRVLTNGLCLGLGKRIDLSVNEYAPPSAMDNNRTKDKKAA